MATAKATLINVGSISNAAKIEVVVVPILAPIMKGKAWFGLTFWVATSGTTSDVVTELD